VGAQPVSAYWGAGELLPFFIIRHNIVISYRGLHMNRFWSSASVARHRCLLHAGQRDGPSAGVLKARTSDIAPRPGSPIGVLAGCLTVNHSLVKSMMFFLSGNILMKYRSRSLDVVKGLMQAAPLTSFFLLGGVFALVGVPPFNIFLSKFMIVSAGIATGHLLVIIVCLLLLMVAFVAFLRC
jgi:hypothetical protein